MFALPLTSFHIGFVGGAPGSGAAEVTTLAAYPGLARPPGICSGSSLNPRYGWARFRKGEIWWHDTTWIGRFPIDYWSALVASLVIAAAARRRDRRLSVLARHAALVAGFALLTLLVVAAAPAYMRWYAHMRRPGSDERSAAFPPNNGGGKGNQPLDEAQGRSKLETHDEANSGSGGA